MAKLNLTKTQRGYVPLVDRFKSFPKDDEKSPKDDAEFYFDNYANQTLEHATLDLLYPTPQWLRERLQFKRGSVLLKFLETGQGPFRIANGSLRLVVVKK